MSRTVCRSVCLAGVVMFACACIEEGPVTDGDAGRDDDPGSPGSVDAGQPDDDSPPGADARPGDDDPDGERSVTCAELPNVSGLATVIECVPDGMEGPDSDPAPLVVALHGYTQTAAEYRDTTEWHHLAAEYGFYVAFPEVNADLVNAGGLPGAWKWWRDYADWTRDSFNQHYDPILSVVDAVEARHDIDEERVYLTGLSAGGYMTTLMLAAYPDVFAAGASFSGGPHNCDVECTDSNKLQDWTRPPGYQPPGADDVVAAYPEHWNDPGTRKPRLILFHGQKDEAVKPVNLSDAMVQWTGALGIDQTPDNASLGEPDELGGYPYDAHEYQGEVGVATVLMTDLGHGTPVSPGGAPDQGGHDPMPSDTANDCNNVNEPGCEQDWTNTGSVYGPYQAARFFGLIP